MSSSSPVINITTYLTVFYCASSLYYGFVHGSPFCKDKHFGQRYYITISEFLSNIPLHKIYRIIKISLLHPHINNAFFTGLCLSCLQLFITTITAWAVSGLWTRMDRKNFVFYILYCLYSVYMFCFVLQVCMHYYFLI